MKKYIDYGKLLEERYRLGLDEMSRISKVNAFNHFIDTMPSADVAEVQHGKWKIEEYKNHLNVVCSNCNKEFYVYKQGQYRIDRSNYCPNCGAKMGKGQEC